MSAATGFGTGPAQNSYVAVALVLLFIGVICSLIGRILLIGAAFSISAWWGIGVLLPFGPLLFRLSYPELAPMSRVFRLAALPCFLAFFVMQPNSVSSFRKDRFFKSAQEPAAPANHYGFEKLKTASQALEERRAANEKELSRLRAEEQALRLKKRDLLRSDAEGNLVYSIEVTKYNDAVKKALAEKELLDKTPR